MDQNVPVSASGAALCHAVCKQSGHRLKSRFSSSHQCTLRSQKTTSLPSNAFQIALVIALWVLSSSGVVAKPRIRLTLDLFHNTGSHKTEMTLPSHPKHDIIIDNKGTHSGSSDDGQLRSLFGGKNGLKRKLSQEELPSSHVAAKPGHLKSFDPFRLVTKEETTTALPSQTKPSPIIDNKDTKAGGDDASQLRSLLGGKSGLKRKRTYEDLECRGMFDHGIMAQLERVCEDCYNLYKDPEVYGYCRMDCFKTPTFGLCLKSLLMDSEADKFLELVEIIGKKKR